MNQRKRSAAEPLLPLRVPKQQRTAFFRSDGACASPSASGSILSRWRDIGKDVYILTKDTVNHLVQGPEQLHRNRKFHSFQSRTPDSSIPRTRPRRSSSQTSSPASPEPPSRFTFSVPSTPRPPAGPSRFVSTRQPSTQPLSPSQRKTRRPRSRAPMGPPPVPLKSSERFPTLPPSPVNSNVSRAGSYVRFPRRDHILQDKHKMDVKQARGELMKLYNWKKLQGYRGDFSTFKTWALYAEQIRQAEEKREKRASMTGLERLQEHVEEMRPRRYSSPDTSTALVRSLEKARATLGEPKPPPPFMPTLDLLRLRDRTKDAAIEQRLRPKIPTSLPPKDEAAVDAFFKKRGNVSKYAREAVSDDDIRRLRPGEWLNDEIINFYGAMILGRSDECKENNRAGGNHPLNAHYFSTFFYQKLEREGYEKARLAKWTKKFDLFAKDVVLIPVNQNNVHWSSAAINFRKKRIETYDSMGGNPQRIFRLLRSYIDEEHRNKKKMPFDFTGWEDYTLEDTPQQENGCDCGVFTCHFLEALSRGEEIFRFTQSDMPYLRRRMVWEIGNAKLWADP